MRRLPLCLASLCLAATAPAGEAGRLADQAALKPYGGLVGTWKGAGLPRRGSTKGSWSESAGWAWSLSADSAALELKLDNGKYLKSARLKPGEEPKTFVVDAVLADGAPRSFAGKPGPRDSLVLTAEGPAAEGVARLTLSPLHETRFLLLLESKDADGDFARLGEVGYTRKGVAFAAGDSSPACIVTGGRGTIAVNYQGKTYYVCCSGCKELFEEEPAKMVAEAEAREKAKKK